MGQLIKFEERAVARLRERLGAVEEANEDLIAFARGHSGAVASIHSAALAAVEAADIDQLLQIVALRWPLILGIDSAALAVIVGSQAFRADSTGAQRIEGALIERLVRNRARVEVRSVANGHPLFGSAVAAEIRAEALIRIDSPPSLPCGLLALGQRAALERPTTTHGSELLLFLGEVVAATLRRFAACR